MKTKINDFFKINVQQIKQIKELQDRPAIGIDEMTLTINTGENITAVTKIPDKIKYYKNEIVFVKITMNEGYIFDPENSTFTPSDEIYVFTETKPNLLFLVPMTENITMNLVSVEAGPIQP